MSPNNTLLNDDSVVTDLLGSEPLNLNNILSSYINDIAKLITNNEREFKRFLGFRVEN